MFHLTLDHMRTILCDVVPMDAWNFLLSKPWQYYINSIHDVNENTYNVQKEGNWIY
jgi:hypothetical protein